MVFLRALLVIFFVSSVSSAEKNDGDSVIKINILSRPVRLMREGMLPNLVFSTGGNAVIINEMNNDSIMEGNKIIVSFDRGTGQAAIGSKLLNNKFRIRIVSRGNTGYITVTVQNIERRYPLPFVAECGGGGGVIHFYSWAPLNRYCFDSAVAEYGNLTLLNREAVFSLAHLIRARAVNNKKTPRHKDADFCDLTHCQVYRGIAFGGGSLDDNWNIDMTGCRETIYFHAGCGGETYGNWIFGNDGRKEACSTSGVRDWLYRDGVRLCSGPGSNWSREIGMAELCSILFKSGPGAECRDMAVEYNRQFRIVKVRRDNTSVPYPPETFRLKVNRVKGWNFIKSNNYSISESTKNGKKIFIFRGRGNGHGVGLCQEGAYNLSRMGYSRYEIVEHYYPDIAFVKERSGEQLNPYLSYCIFDLATGAILASNPGNRILQRRVPPGSVFKLFVLLYVAQERRDIFNDYKYTCTGNNALDGTLPERCWHRNGHGTLNIRDAIAHSCNLYFASLHNRISYKNFYKFYVNFCRCAGIPSALPEIANDSQWAKMLAGLDFRIDFRVQDYIRLVQFLNSGTLRSRISPCGDLPDTERIAIFQAMGDTFISGTASGKIRPYGSRINYTELLASMKGSDQKEVPGVMWGKTATVLDGTNRPVSYGLFIGGSGDRGIVALLRKGNGSLSARWARIMLQGYAGSHR